MARNNISYSHGDNGSEPSSALDFQQNQRPDAQNFDWFWSTVINRINGINSEFNRLDSDDDGRVDAADQADNADMVDGEHADAFADAGHDHNHDELTNVGSSDHHSRYTDSETVAAVNGETSLTVDIAGDANSVDGLDSTDFARLYDGVQLPTFATTGDVPAMSKGEVVFVDSDGLYIEDGT